MSFSKSFEDLEKALTCLPGVGAKTAQRMALELLLKKKHEAKILSHAIDCAINSVKKCQRCRNLSDEDLCLICGNAMRDQNVLCVVEAPSDVLALERSTDYQGLYFVLLGHIAPLDGIGPEELGLDVLDKRLAEGEVEELVLATNSTLEGEATAYFLSQLAKKHHIKATRLAHGVPMGGELSYIDKNTLSLAFKTRTVYEQ